MYKLQEIIIKFSMLIAIFSTLFTATQIATTLLLAVARLNKLENRPKVLKIQAIFASLGCG